MHNNDPLSSVDVDLNLYNHFRDDGLDSNKFDSESFNCFSDDKYAGNRNSLSLVHMNIRSLQRNYDSLVVSLGTLKLSFDVVALTETWLKKETQDIYFPYYKSYHSMRSNRIGGGTAIYIKNKLESREIVELTANNSDIECVFIEIKQLNSRLVIGCVYRPPSGNILTFQDELSSRLSVTDPGGTETLLCGDFNLDLLRIDSNFHFANFYESLLTFSLFLTISIPTHTYFDRNGRLRGSVLDNIITSNLNYVKSGIIEFDITDHYPIFILFNNLFRGQDHNQQELIEYRLINDFTINNFIEKVSSINFDQKILPIIDCDFTIVSLNNSLFEIYNGTCPIKTKRISDKDKKFPWVNYNLKQLIKKRDKDYKKMKRGIILPETYRLFKNYVTSKVRNAKKLYYHNLFHSLKSNIKKTWKTINNTIKPSRCKSKKLIESVVSNNTEHQGSSICGPSMNTLRRLVSESMIRLAIWALGVHWRAPFQTQFLFQMCPKTKLKILFYR